MPIDNIPEERKINYGVLNTQTVAPKPKYEKKTTEIKDEKGNVVVKTTEIKSVNPS